jgi:hypothetical protein
MKRAGSRAGSVSQRYRSADPEPYQYGTVPEDGKKTLEYLDGGVSLGISSALGTAGARPPGSGHSYINHILFKKKKYTCNISNKICNMLLLDSMLAGIHPPCADLYKVNKLSEHRLS